MRTLRPRPAPRWGLLVIALAATGGCGGGTAPAAPAAAPPQAPASPVQAAPAAPAPKTGEWVNSFEEARTRAARERRLMMVDFYTDWCGWCKKLDKDVFRQPNFLTMAGPTLCVRINAEKGKGIGLARKYNVTGFPRILFLDWEGRVLEVIAGYRPPDQWPGIFTRMHNGQSQRARLEQAVETNPQNLQANFLLAKFLSEAGEVETSMTYWERALGTPATNQNYLQTALLLGETFTAAGKPDRAADVLAPLLDQFPTHQDRAIILYLLAQARTGQNRKSDAQALYEEIIQKHSHHRVVRFARMELARLNTR